MLHHDFQAQTLPEYQDQKVAELEQKYCSLTKVGAADFAASVEVEVEQIDVAPGTAEAADNVDADRKINGYLLVNAGTESSSALIDQLVEPLYLASAERQSSLIDW